MYQSQLLALSPGEFVFSKHFVPFLFGMSFRKKTLARSAGRQVASCSHDLHVKFWSTDNVRAAAFSLRLAAAEISANRGSCGESRSQFERHASSLRSGPPE